MNNYVYSRKNQDNFLKSSWFFLYKMNFVIFSSPLYIYTYYLFIYIFSFSSPSSCFSIKFK
ncbi:hypothetical protein COK35_22475 [Bacillus cereus]|nr:hypothetical protein CN291_29225 [Bacillus cereus]PFR47103.1 hypothetical protein COK35_22475 [Bacillus cereus]PGW22672.1 hypothetical protein COD88_27025 [Bacillus cereus]